MQNTLDFQLLKTATFVCCPLCDEPKCVGRFNCEEIRQWVLRKLEELESD